MAGDTRNKKHILKEQRNEALREQLRGFKLIPQIVESANKVEQAAGTMTANEIQAHKFATETRLKLLDKILPSIKSIELKDGEDGDGIVTAIERRIIRASSTPNP